MRSNSKNNIVIIGDGEFADIAFDYFTNDSKYNVVAFAVEKKFFTKKIFNHKPVCFLEDIESVYPKDKYMIFVAISSTKLNRIRRRIYSSLKDIGYSFVSYLSSHAFKSNSAVIGENTFIFENNVIQSNVLIGNNCIIWSGNHIGHRSEIKNHVFISSHAVISGYCTIEDCCFIGVNSTIADNITVETDCIIGAGAIILKNTKRNSIYPSSSTKPSMIKSLKFHKLMDD